MASTIGFDTNQLCVMRKDHLGGHFYNLVMWLKATVFLTSLCHFEHMVDL